MEHLEIDGATRVSVMRHGEVAGRPHVFRGALDDPLTPAGFTRMQAVISRLSQPQFDRIATSPLIRCAAFAQEYCTKHGISLDTNAAFAELSFGAWEGLTPEEAANRDPDAYRQFRQSAGQSAPPGGESADRLRRRVTLAWQEWLADANGGHRLLVTHAGVMRALLVELLGLPPNHIYRIALPETAHFTVSILPGAAPVLLALNSCAD